MYGQVQPLDVARLLWAFRQGDIKAVRPACYAVAFGKLYVQSTQEGQLSSEQHTTCAYPGAPRQALEHGSIHASGFRDGYRHSVMQSSSLTMRSFQGVAPRSNQGHDLRDRGHAHQQSSRASRC
jgi:hypothetical protein